MVRYRLVDTNLYLTLTWFEDERKLSIEEKQMDIGVAAFKKGELGSTS